MKNEKFITDIKEKHIASFWVKGKIVKAPRFNELSDSQKTDFLECEKRWSYEELREKDIYFMFNSESPIKKVLNSDFFSKKKDQEEFINEDFLTDFLIDSSEVDLDFLRQIEFEIEDKIQYGEKSIATQLDFIGELHEAPYDAEFLLITPYNEDKPHEFLCSPIYNLRNKDNLLDHGNKENEEINRTICDKLNGKMIWAIIHILFPKNNINKLRNYLKEFDF